MNTPMARYLPAYEDTISPYSLRLPTYRSSYVRRYHPYARYIHPHFCEQNMDDIDREEVPFLDLSILDRRIPVEGTYDAQNQREQPVQQPLVIVPEAIEVIVREEDTEDSLDQTGLFIRIDMIQAIAALEKLRVD